MSNLAHFRAGGAVYPVHVKTGEHTGARLYSGNGGAVWFADPLKAIQSGARRQASAASRRLDDLKCRQAEGGGDLEGDTLQNMIERAYWEVQQAKARLDELLALKQCEAWEQAEALTEIE